MKIQNIGTPLILNYYYSKNDIENIASLLKDGFCSETNDKLREKTIREECGYGISA